MKNWKGRFATSGSFGTDTTEIKRRPAGRLFSCLDTELLLAVVGNVQMLIGERSDTATAGGIGLDGAGNDFDEGHLTDEGVGDGLEADGCERAVRVAGQFDFVAVLVSRGLAGLGAGGGAEVDEAVQQLVDAFELVGGAGVNGIDVTVGDALEQTGQRFDFGEGFAFEIFFHELVAGGGNGFIEHVSVGVELVGLGHVDFDRLAVLVLVALVLGQVDEVTDLTFFDERDDDRAKLVAVDFLHGLATRSTQGWQVHLAS